MRDETDSAGLPAAPPGNHGRDQRADRRVALLLRAGKLVSPEGEFLCIVRDASAGGIKVKLLHSLPGAGTFDLELANGEVYPLELVWQADGHAGFRFLERPIDVHGLVDEPSSFPKRGLRLRLTLPVIVIEAGEERPALLRDISQHGAQIEIEPGLAVGQRIALHGSGWTSWPNWSAACARPNAAKMPGSAPPVNQWLGIFLHFCPRPTNWGHNGCYRLFRRIEHRAIP